MSSFFFNVFSFIFLSVVYCDALKGDRTFARALARQYEVVPVTETIGLIGKWPTLSFGVILWNLGLP